MQRALKELDIIIRLSLAFSAGYMIGINCSSRKQGTGLRAYILISLGACCLMQPSLCNPLQIDSGYTGKIAARLAAGMSFPGAVAVTEK